MLLSTIGVVLFMPLMAPLLIKGLMVDSWSLARPLLIMVLAPLLIGVAFRVFAQNAADRLLPVIQKIGGLFLVIVLVLTLVGRHAVATGPAPREWQLSDREADVLRLVQRGLSTRAIAGELTISPNTVKTHLRAIFDKSGFRTRAALIANTRPPSIG